MSTRRQCQNDLPRLLLVIAGVDALRSAERRTGRHVVLLRSVHERLGSLHVLSEEADIIRKGNGHQPTALHVERHSAIR